MTHFGEADVILGNIFLNQMKELNHQSRYIAIISNNSINLMMRL